MLELMETGIIDHWDLWFLPLPIKCMGNIQSGRKPQDGKTKTLRTKNQPPALSLKNFTGAFVILLFGFSLSILAFLCEQVIEWPFLVATADDWRKLEMKASSINQEKLHSRRVHNTQHQRRSYNLLT
jgi:hypothetical protein